MCFSGGGVLLQPLDKAKKPRLDVSDELSKLPDELHKCGKAGYFSVRQRSALYHPYPCSTRKDYRAVRHPPDDPTMTTSSYVDSYVGYNAELMRRIQDKFNFSLSHIKWLQSCIHEKGVPLNVPLSIHQLQPLREDLEDVCVNELLGKKLTAERLRFRLVDYVPQENDISQASSEWSLAKAYDEPEFTLLESPAKDGGNISSDAKRGTSGVEQKRVDDRLEIDETGADEAELKEGLVKKLRQEIAGISRIDPGMAARLSSYVKQIENNSQPSVVASADGSSFPHARRKGESRDSSPLLTSIDMPAQRHTASRERHSREKHSSQGHSRNSSRHRSRSPRREISEQKNDRTIEEHQQRNSQPSSVSPHSERGHSKDNRKVNGKQERFVGNSNTTRSNGSHSWVSRHQSPEERQSTLAHGRIGNRKEPEAKTQDSSERSQVEQSSDGHNITVAHKIRDIQLSTDAALRRSEEGIARSTECQPPPSDALSLLIDQITAVVQLSTSENPVVKILKDMKNLRSLLMILATKEPDTLHQFVSLIQNSTLTLPDYAVEALRRKLESYVEKYSEEPTACSPSNQAWLGKTIKQEPTDIDEHEKDGSGKRPAEFGVIRRKVGATGSCQGQQPENGDLNAMMSTDSEVPRCDSNPSGTTIFGPSTASGSQSFLTANMETGDIKMPKTDESSSSSMDITDYNLSSLVAAAGALDSDLEARPSVFPLLSPKNHVQSRMRGTCFAGGTDGDGLRGLSSKSNPAPPKPKPKISLGVDWKGGTIVFPGKVKRSPPSEDDRSFVDLFSLNKDVSESIEPDSGSKRRMSTTALNPIEPVTSEGVPIGQSVSSYSLMEAVDGDDDVRKDSNERCPEAMVEDAAPEVHNVSGLGSTSESRFFRKTPPVERSDSVSTSHQSSLMEADSNLM